MQETQVRSQGWEDPLEKGMATHSSILAWRIPWTEEPGELLHESMGSQSVEHDWATNPFTLLLFFPVWSFQLFYYFLFIWIASLNHSLRVHLLATHSFSFWSTSILFLIVASSIYIPTNCEKGSFPLYFLQHLLFIHFLRITILTGVRDLIVVFINKQFLNG